MDQVSTTTVSFLSDYGLQDEFVGVCHSVIHGLSDNARVVDITHEIPPYDVRAGGLTLARCAQYLSPGVVMAIVDPGVGTNRRAIGVEVGNGVSVLIGPDNGVLAPAVAMVGGATSAVALDNPDFQLPSPAATFDGRDVFAPAAAHLCNGVPMSELGSEIDTATLFPATMPISHVEDGALIAEVLWVDHFGNVQLNVDPDDLADFGTLLELQAHGRKTVVPIVPTFVDAPKSSVALIADSYGLMAAVAERASAAEYLDVAAGDEVTIGSSQMSASEASASAEVQVSLGTKPPSDTDTAEDPTSEA